HGRHFARVSLTELLEANRRVFAQLRAQFPGAPESKADHIGRGAAIAWDWTTGKNGEKPSTDVAIVYDLNRTNVGGWLKSIQSRSVEAREIEDQLVWSLKEAE